MKHTHTHRDMVGRKQIYSCEYGEHNLFLYYLLNIVLFLSICGEAILPQILLIILVYVCILHSTLVVGKIESNSIVFISNIQDQAE